ncbi:MAG: glycosyltransferase family 2 protein [Verrucomicrobia bacterium]|nr:glycosyltransferase family 2 protein [Verrucomicrobiota bacterium]
MKICLNMIVKNEAAVIERCLSSVKNLIDYWVIADTGSTDGTQEIIRQSLAGIPGELHERPWIDFSHNRNEVLQLSKGKGDYLLFIDADEKLIATSFQKKLEKDHYFIQVQQPDGSQYYRVAFVKNGLDWKWRGAIHEEIFSSEAKSVGTLEGIINFSDSSQGARSQDPEKYLKDAALLEKEPETPRTLFFLGLSYGNALQFDKALKNYKKRAALGGDEEEVFFSLFCIANAQQHLGYPPETFIQSFIKAHLYRPTRTEPLYALAYYYSETANPFFAYLISQYGLTLPPTKDTHFVVDYKEQLQLVFEKSGRALGKSS